MKHAAMPKLTSPRHRGPVWEASLRSMGILCLLLSSLLRFASVSLYNAVTPVLPLFHSSLDYRCPRSLAGHLHAAVVLVARALFFTCLLVRLGCWWGGYQRTNQRTHSLQDLNFGCIYQLSAACSGSRCFANASAASHPQRHWPKRICIPKHHQSTFYFSAGHRYAVLFTVALECLLMCPLREGNPSNFFFWIKKNFPQKSKKTF